MALFLFAGFALLTVIGMPIAFSLGVSTALTLILFADVPLVVIAQRVIAGYDSFVLLAVPLFILTGSLMSRGSLAVRLLDLGTALVGHIRGGLAHGTIVGSALFGAISGSALADACAIGSLAIPAMVKQRYDRAFATTVVAVASTLDALIPPSVIMVIYGWQTDSSVPALFAGGFIPGILLGLFLMAITHYYAVVRNYPTSPRVSGREMLRVVMRSVSILVAPVVILGGILSGVFTATEAAAVAVVCVLVLEGVVFRTLRHADLMSALLETAVLNAAVMLVFGMASSFAWLLISQGTPQAVSSFIVSISPNRVVFLMYINILFFVVGLFLTPIPAMIIFLPLLMPVVQRFGIDVVHFGMIMTLNLSIGLLTPPVGPVLLATCRIGEVPLSHVIKPFIPYLGVLILVTLVITYVPWFTLVLPTWLGLIR